MIETKFYCKIKKAKVGINIEYFTAERFIRQEHKEEYDSWS